MFSLEQCHCEAPSGTWQLGHKVSQNWLKMQQCVRMCCSHPRECLGALSWVLTAHHPEMMGLMMSLLWQFVPGGQGVNFGTGQWNTGVTSELSEGCIREKSQSQTQKRLQLAAETTAQRSIQKCQKKLFQGKTYFNTWELLWWEQKTHPPGMYLTDAAKNTFMKKDGEKIQVLLY